MAPDGSSLLFPILGVLLSNALYFSPLPAIVRAHTHGALGVLNPLPQALMVLSTNAWICYALAVPNGFILCSNLPGAIASVAFVVITLPLIPREAVATRFQVQLVLVVGTGASLSLWTCLIFYQLDHAARCFWLGAYGSALCVLLFASPLSTMREVLATSNAASIYAPLTIAQCTNCLMWTIYGFSIGDVWVWGPNSTGLGLGVVQLTLKLVFPSRARRHEEQRNLCKKESCSDRGSDDDSVVDMVVDPHAGAGMGAGACSSPVGP